MRQARHVNPRKGNLGTIYSRQNGVVLPLEFHGYYVNNMYITRTKEISIIRSYQWQCGPQNITGFSTISFFKCTNHEPLRTKLVPSSLFCVGQILIAKTDCGKLHFTFTLSVTSSLPRQTGSVLIDTGCIGCP